jgi:hypothetical protein
MNVPNRAQLRLRQAKGQAANAKMNPHRNGSKMVVLPGENIIAVNRSGDKWNAQSQAKSMKPNFVRIYLAVTTIILGATALAKLPAIFHERNWCIDDAILGHFQPDHVSNEQLLGFAAGAELLIVLLVFFSPRRWLPCIAAAAWGLLCFLTRLFLMDPYGNCRCLGWLAKPGPRTNLAAALIALFLAGGGWVAFRMAWSESKRGKLK